MVSVKTRSLSKILLVGFLAFVAGAGGLIASHFVHAWPVDLPSGLSLSPDAIHVVPGEGRRVGVFVARSAAFGGAVQVSVVNPPSWVTVTPLIIDSSASNGTLELLTAANAPKGPVVLTVQGATASGATQTAQLYLKVVSTFGVTSDYGSAVLYDTTKLLNDTATLQALVSYTDDSLTFSQTTPFLQSLDHGDVIIIDPNVTSVIPRGLFRMVRSIQQSSGGVAVLTEHATLLDAFLQARGPHSPLNVTFDVIPNQLFPIPPALFQAKGGQQNLVITPPSFVFGVQLTFGLDITWSCCGFPSVDYFQLTCHTYATAGASVKSAGPVNVQYDLSVPDPPNHLWGPIWIWAPYLELDMFLAFDLMLSGSLNQAIDISYGTEIDGNFGPEYCMADFCGGKYGWKFVNNINEISKSGGWNSIPAAFGSGGSVKVSLGPTFQVLLDGTLGNTLGEYYWVSINAQTPREPSVWWLDAGLDLVPGFQFWSFFGFGTVSASFTALEGHLPGFPINGPHAGPSITITNPTDGAVVNWGADTANPKFTATITDPQGVEDVCSEGGGVGGTNKKVVWSSDVNGPFAHGCSPTLALGSLTSGQHTVTVSATDANGGFSTSSPLKINVNLASLVVVISKPTDGSQVPTGTLTVKGYAYWANPDGTQTQIDCNSPTIQLSWSLAGQGIGQGCTATTNFNNAGQTVPITLDAKVGVVSAEATVKVSFIQPQPNTPPQPTIISPSSGDYYAWTLVPIKLDATVTGNYVGVAWEADWTASNIPYSYPIATGQLPNALPLPYNWDVAGSLCKNSNFPASQGGFTTVKILLTVWDQSNNKGIDYVNVNVQCVNAVGSINVWPLLMTTQYPLLLGGLVFSVLRLKMTHETSAGVEKRQES